jgi:hypothetical protein
LNNSGSLSFLFLLAPTHNSSSPLGAQDARCQRQETTMFAAGSSTHRLWNQLLASLIVLVGLTDSARAAAPPPPFDIRDVEITLYARRAMLQDPDLAKLNLGVSVHYGQATLWGTVQSWEIAERALQVLEKVKGVYGVHSDLRVSGNRLYETLENLRSGSDLPGDGDPVPVVDPVVERGSSQAGVLSKPLGEDPPLQVQNAHPLIPPEKEDSPPPSGVALLPPITEATPTSLKAPVVELRAPILTQPEPDPEARPELLKAVEQVRLADERFRRVRVEVREGVVVLAGSVHRAEHLIELAQSLSRVPGVRSIDLRGVLTSR